MPDFEGQLRFMALVYNKTQLGAAEANVAVRDPVVADATLPRFLAPGDKSRLTLLLHNVEGAAGDYKLSLAASGAVELDDEGERTVTLASGERKTLALAIAGRESGVGSFALSLSGPGGFAAANAGHAGPECRAPAGPGRPLRRLAHRGLPPRHRPRRPHHLELAQLQYPGPLRRT